MKGAGWLLTPFVLLVAIGCAMIFSTSTVVGYSNFDDSYFFIKKQLIFLALGSIAFYIGYKIPVNFYRQWLGLGYIFALVLLLLTLVPGVGIKIGGAHRWLNLGVMTIQPVEVMKFFVVIFLATAIANKKETMVSFIRGSFPLLCIVSLPILILAFQPDLGNTGLILAVSLTTLFIGKMPLSQLFALMVVGIGIIGANLYYHPYQMQRIQSFLSPWDDPMGQNYHMVQSLIAIGSGGFTGLGLGESKLKFFYLPLQYSDFIFSVVCEEGGWILGCGVVILFAWLFFMGLRVSMRQKDAYVSIVGLGLILMVTYQALFNMGVVTGLLPVTGIPLTFISFGGTSLLMSMFFMGVLAQISGRHETA